MSAEGDSSVLLEVTEDEDHIQQDCQNSATHVTRMSKQNVTSEIEKGEETMKSRNHEHEKLRKV